MPTNELWFRRRKESLREPCPICKKNLIPLGGGMCFECAAKKQIFGDD